MKKIKYKIKIFILKWLGLDKDIRILTNKIKNQENDILLFKKLLKVGVDFHEKYNHSWAVVCIEGESEYVQFVRLGRKEVREVAMFLKQFRGSQITIDRLYGMPKEMFF